jgi:hypothetical protein
VSDIQASGWIFLLLGAATLIQGIRFRSGIGRRNLAENYRDMRVPRLRRNAPFAAVPLGLAFALVGVAALKGSDVPPGLVLVLAIAGLACVAVAFAVLASPPAWSKPLWLREAEAAGWQGYRPQSGRYDLVFSAILAISVFGAASLIIATSFQLVDLVGPILLGFGTALAFWRGGRRTGGS